jgi:putative peptidoglycan lipid II flippase
MASTTSPPPAAASAAAGAHAERAAMINSAWVVSLMTFLSRILGVIRDRLMASVFGASWVNDAFQIAFLLPNMTRRLFGEGALSSAFVPVFSERLATGRREAAFRTASVLLGRLALGLFIACAALILLSLGARALLRVPAVAGWVAPGAQSLARLELTLRLSEVMLGYCVLINAAAVMMGVLNSLGHFATPAASPLLLNLCMIAACVFGLHWLNHEPSSQIMVVALAVMAGGVLQLLVMLPPALARGFPLRPRLDKQDEGYREVMRGFLPVVFGVALFQVNLLLDQLIARACIPEDGPVTMLAYGNRIVQLPWALFSLSLATAALPMLSRHWAAQKEEEFGRTLSTAVRHTLFLAVPSAVGLCLCSRDLVRLFYGAGEFLRNDNAAVIRTGRVVFFFSLGLVFYGLNSILARAIYATKDTRTPTRTAAICVGLNLVLNLTLVLGTNLKEAGLALSSAISGAAQTAMLAWALFRRVPKPDTRRLARFACTVGLGGVVGGVGSVWAYHWLSATQKNLEGFLVFLIAAMVAILPPWWLGRRFFLRELAPLRLGSPGADEEHRYGVPEERWPNELVFYHGLYTIALASLVMGLLTWTVRDSLPPEGQAFALVLQRGMVPVLAGALAFAMAAGGFASREYDELKGALARRWHRS